MAADFDTIIVGAGPVGATLGWLLAKAGQRVCLLEVEPEPVNQLRASTFHPPTLEMLDADGITAELIAAGRITPTWQIRMHDTGERAEFDLTVLANDTPHPYRLQCRQEVLVNSCLARLNELQPYATRFGCRVTNVSSHASSSQVTYENSAGESVLLSAQWVVGCDGARSAVRESLGIQFDGDAYPESTILATTHFPFEEYLPGLSGVNYVWADATTFSLLRLPDVWRCSFHPLPGQSPEQALANESIKAHLIGIVPQAGEAVIEERRIYKVHHRVANSYRRGRTFLAGDAAHLNSPKGGMGMNGGVHDAFELAKALSDANFNAQDPRLDRYERRRRPVAMKDIIGQADQNRERMQVRDRTARLQRLGELQAIAADPDKARRFLLRSSMIEGLSKARAVQ